MNKSSVKYFHNILFLSSFEHTIIKSSGLNVIDFEKAINSFFLTGGSIRFSVQCKK